MNEKGIKSFLSKIKVGDEIMITTRDGSYEGLIGAIKDTWFTVDGSPIDYNRIWWHSLEI